MKEQFKKDVLDGLSSDPKRLPSKYFYDKKGDELFVKIMNMPEYYLTDAEMEIFQTRQDEIIQKLGISKDRTFELIELGAGDGTKTIHLLRRLLEEGFDFNYNPVDISQNALDGLEQMLAEKLPNLSVSKQQGDYFKVLKDLQKVKHQKVVLFLGSTLGNMMDNKAAQFIYDLGSSLDKGDKLLLGLDLIKDKDIVLPAYNDASGFTRAFNLNLLERINRELGANFNIDQFDHAPTYTKEEGVARSALVSKTDQHVHISALGRGFDFKTGEKIHTEISRKYSAELLKELIQDTDFHLQDMITDSNNYFADFILERR